MTQKRRSTLVSNAVAAATAADGPHDDRTAGVSHETALVIKLVQSFFDSFVAPVVAILLDEHRRSLNLFFDALRSEFARIRARYRDTFVDEEARFVFANADQTLAQTLHLVSPSSLIEFTLDSMSPVSLLVTRFDQTLVDIGRTDDQMCDHACGRMCGQTSNQASNRTRERADQTSDRICGRACDRGFDRARERTLGRNERFDRARDRGRGRFYDRGRTFVRDRSMNDDARGVNETRDPSRDPSRTHQVQPTQPTQLTQPMQPMQPMQPTLPLHPIQSMREIRETTFDRDEWCAPCTSFGPPTRRDHDTLSSFDAKLTDQIKVDPIGFGSPGGTELEFKRNALATTSPTTYKIPDFFDAMLEKYTKYICYVFGDDLDVIRCVTSFTSAEAFDRNTVLYEVPLQRSTGGVFGFGNSTYRIETPLEDSLYRILERMHKLDFYESIVDQLRKYKESIRKCIGMLDRAASLNMNADNVNGFLQDVTRDFAKIARQFVFLYLVNLNDDQIKSMFAGFRNALGQFETESISLLHNFRDSAQHTLIELDEKDDAAGQHHEDGVEFAPTKRSKH